MKLDAICAFLDRELNVAAFEDSSHNGLQVAGPERVRKICVAVDGTLETFADAVGRGADLLVCHHGISWRDSLARLTGLAYRRVAFLVRNNLALYACHLPLDAHPRHGNNVQICKALGIRRLKPFGMYGGHAIGFEGMLEKPVGWRTFLNRIGRKIGERTHTMDFGKSSVRRVAVVSGGGSDCIDEAGEKGVDVFVSGEPTLMAYHLAREHGLNAVFAGHYATERFGVRALGALLKKRFDLDVEFLDFDTPV